MGLLDRPGASSADLRKGIGPIVKVPFTVPTFTAVGSGSSASLGTTQPSNPDGRNQQAVLTAGAGAGCYAGVKDVVYGPLVGLRIPRTGGSLRAPFDIEIDGQVYPIDQDANPRYDNIAALVVDYESLIVVADGLEDKPHTVKVHVSADISAAPVARQLSIFGWLGAQGRGYHQPPPMRVGGFSATAATTIPTTAATIGVPGLCVGLKLVNTDAAARVVTLTGPNGTDVFDKVYLAAAGTEGDVKRIPFDSAPRTLAGCKWSVDSSTAVKGWVEIK